MYFIPTSDKTSYELEEMKTHKHTIELWSHMGNNDMKLLFDCILKRNNPNGFSVEILKSKEFSDDIKYIVSNVFYSYLTSVKRDFKIDNEFISDWKEAYESFPIEDDDNDIQSDDYFLKEYISNNKTLMYRYILDHHFSNKFLQNKLIVLKGWSSATPIINSYFRNDYCNGGGFYVNINGTGIVVDPGCNFIKNMHEQGIRIFDIQYIIVTHNHIDHNANIMELQNLNYEYNSYIAKYSKDVLNHKKIPKNYPNKITWIIDKETKKTIDSNTDFFEQINISKDDNFKINEFIVPDLDNDSCEENLNDKATKKFINETQVQTITIENSLEPIKLTCFRTYHMKNSYGIYLKSLINKDMVSIGFTSDTGYFKRLPDLLNDCKIIIENISELADEDLKPGGIPINANHLKLNGCIKTIAKMSNPPKLVLVSEFWGGKDDIRLFITKRIQEGIVKTTKLKDDSDIETPRVLAADIGLTVKLDNYTVLCSACGKEVSANKISTVQNEKYGQLKYICHRCHA